MSSQKTLHPMSRQLKVIATSCVAATAAQLKQQLSSLAYVECLGVVRTLEEAHALASRHPAPDALLVDLTERELDGGLFLQTLTQDEAQPLAIVALHHAMDGAMIVKCARHGAREFVSYPSDPEALADGLKRLHNIVLKVAQPVSVPEMAQQALQQAAQPAQPCEVLTVFSPKGGGGATTLAIHLATEIRRLTKAPTLMLDMDQLFNNTAVLLNIKPNLCLSDLCKTGADALDPSMLAGFVQQHESGIHVLATSKNILDQNDLLTPPLLNMALQFARQQYRYLVVDLPSHSVDAFHQYWVEQATQSLVVTQLDIPGLYRTRQYLELAGQFVSQEKLKLIVNRYDLKSALGLTNQQLEAELRYPVTARLANQWDAAVEANSLGKLITQVGAGSELALQYEKLARQMCQLPSGGGQPVSAGVPVKASGGTPLSGLLGKLFKSQKDTIAVGAGAGASPYTSVEGVT